MRAGIEDWATRWRRSSDGAYHHAAINPGRANVAIGEEERVLHGNGVLLERMLGLEFEVSAGAFLQTNSRQAETLYETALQAAEIGSDETVLDLYCGTGTLTLMCARRARAAVGVESAGSAVACARRNAGRNQVANAPFVEGEADAAPRRWARGERPDGVHSRRSGRGPTPGWGSTFASWRGSRSGCHGESCKLRSAIRRRWARTVKGLRGARIRTDGGHANRHVPRPYPSPRVRGAFSTVPWREPRPGDR